MGHDLVLMADLYAIAVGMLKEATADRNKSHEEAEDCHDECLKQ